MADPSEIARAAAAEAAARLVEPGMTVGLGSGRAVWKLVERLGEQAGAFRAVTASNRTQELAAGLGIEMIELDGEIELDLALDGADEVDPALRLIKGGGGALLREKIVISAARRFVVVAETPKRVGRLGEHFRLPVEVVRFAWRDTRVRLLELVESAELRRGDDGEPYVTDEGHYLLDCAPRATGAMAELASAVKAMPGVVEHGLFLTEADLALLGRPDGEVERLER